MRNKEIALAGTLSHSLLPVDKAITAELWTGVLEVRQCLTHILPIIISQSFIILQKVRNNISSLLTYT